MKYIFILQKIDLFAEQISTLKEGDYVIHENHGVGKYLCLESMNIGSRNSYFLIIFKHEDFLNLKM